MRRNGLISQYSHQQIQLKIQKLDFKTKIDDGKCFYSFDLLENFHICRTCHDRFFHIQTRRKHIKYEYPCNFNVPTRRRMVKYEYPLVHT